MVTGNWSVVSGQYGRSRRSADGQQWATLTARAADIDTRRRTKSTRASDIDIDSGYHNAASRDPRDYLSGTSFAVQTLHKSYTGMDWDIRLTTIVTRQNITGHRVDGFVSEA